MPLFRPARRRSVASWVRVSLAAGCLVIPWLVTAAPVASTPIRNAVLQAWQQHPTARATEATLAAAQARADAAAQPLYNPELEWSSEREGSDRTRTLGLSLALDVSGKRRARASVGQSELRHREAQARGTRQGFASQWLASWSRGQAARQRLQLGEERRVLMTRFADLAQKQYGVGDISALERDFAALARDQAEADYAALAAEFADAEAALQAIGTDLATSPALDGAALPSAEIVSADVLTQLPEWQEAEAIAAAATGAVQVARTERRPDPTLRVSSGRIDLGSATDQVATVSVSLPLFVRNSYRAEVVAATAEADAASAEAQRIQLELGARMKRATTTYEATRAAWKRWRSNPATSRESRVTLLERLWRAGELSTADYLQQINQTLDTALAGAELESRLWQSATDYLVATGRLESWLGWSDAGELTR